MGRWLGGGQWTGSGLRVDWRLTGVDLGWTGGALEVQRRWTGGGLWRCTGGGRDVARRGLQVHLTRMQGGLEV